MFVVSIFEKIPVRMMGFSKQYNLPSGVFLFLKVWRIPEPSKMDNNPSPSCLSNITFLGLVFPLICPRPQFVAPYFKESGDILHLAMGRCPSNLAMAPIPSFKPSSYHFLP